MTESAAPIEHVRSDVLPPITPAQAAAFQDACAAPAAIHSARELGAIARLTEAPADAAAVAADCGLTRQGAAAILSTLAGLDLLSIFCRWLGQGGFEDPRRRDLPSPFAFSLITAIRR